MTDLRSEFAALAAIAAEEREARLSALSRSDPQGVMLLRKLLEADGLTGPLTLGISPGRVVGVREGDRVGAFVLERRVGEGATSVVFEARQIAPVERVAAVKILKPLHASAAVARRFETEKRALSSMQHPNVATIYDAGATGDGVPFIAMEFVSGERITSYCERARPRLRDRLELIIQLCDGVQHAHTKALLHRDLKPANVLVTDEGGTPRVKVIDFGIAKALTDAPGTDMALSTAALGIVGTPAYMAPEQAGVGGQDIDARADVYSLGVILYEMLTGERPIDDASLSTTDLATLQRVLSMQEPVKPSERARAVRGARDEGVVIESRQLRGDLDWIVMKCLEKDRERRYGTPAALAEDLRRFMQDAPVTAGPPGGAYRMRKFVKRNRAGVGAAAAVSLVLVAATAVSSALAVREARQRRFAEAARAKESRSRYELQRLADIQAFAVRSVRPRELANTVIERIRVESVGSARDDAERTALEELWKSVLARGELASAGSDALAEQLLMPLARWTEESNAGMFAKARVLETVADTLGRLGRAAESADLQGRVVKMWDEAHAEGELHVPLSLRIGARTLLARPLMQLGHLDEADRVLAEGLSLAAGPMQTDDVESEVRNAEAILLLEVAMLRGRQRRPSDGIEPARRAAKIFLDIEKSGASAGQTPIRANIAVAQLSMAQSLSEAGRMPEALELFERWLPEYEASGHGDESFLASTRNNYGVALGRSGKWLEASLEHALAIDIQRRVLGEHHAATAAATYNAGFAAIKGGDYDAAERLLTAALESELLNPILGREYWMHHLRSCIGEAVSSKGEFDRAELMLLEAFEKMKPPPADARRKLQAAERLVAHFERRHKSDPAAGHDRRAAQWRGTVAELARPPAPTSTN